MLAERALALARRGLWIFPCRPRGKGPATTNGCKDATTDPDAIERWWRQEPEFNIAIATGARSHIFVLDVDGIDAEAELKKLESENSALPATVEAITARGRHLYFEWSDKSPVRNSAGKIAPELDTRGEGGYVLAPPSVHPNGRRYAWSVDSANTFAQAPAWLLERISGARTNGNGHDATPPSKWRELAKGVAEGQRDCTAAQLAGHLLRRRVDPFVVLELLRGWNARCTPPLPETDIERIVASIAKCELTRRFGNGG
jgi:hypothetical protein